MRLTAQEEDLVRWCYLTGFSRARLARDFECSIAEVEEIVSSGLARTLNPSSKAAEGNRKPRQLDFQGVTPQIPTPKLGWEQLLDVLRSALTAEENATGPGSAHA
jgi:hypothetical protein